MEFCFLTVDCNSPVFSLLYLNLSLNTNSNLPNVYLGVLNEFLDEVGEPSGVVTKALTLDFLKLDTDVSLILGFVLLFTLYVLSVISSISYLLKLLAGLRVFFLVVLDLMAL